ncbi:MAG: hypothetical protein ACOCXC_04255, partial [Fibrobacterota bacterium]
ASDVHFDSVGTTLSVSGCRVMSVGRFRLQMYTSTQEELRTSTRLSTSSLRSRQSGLSTGSVSGCEVSYCQK